MRALFNELSSLWKLYFQTPRQAKRIVFYAEHEGYYPNFEGLIKELVGRQRGKVSYITSSETDPLLKQPPSGVSVFYFDRLLPFLMLVINCRTFIMTLTELGSTYLPRSINPVNYVYIFHSLVSTHMMYRANAFDNYDTIMCAGPYQVRELRAREEKEHLPAKRLIEAGYYRLERIYAGYRSRRMNKENKRVVLIAPSWGKENVIESCGEKLADILLGAGFSVIMRPHPETIIRNPAQIDAIQDRYKSCTDFKMERSIISDDSLIIADVLISDCSGVALEYALGTERPVIFIDVPIKVQNPEFSGLKIEPFELSIRQKLGMIVDPNEIGLLPAKIDLLTSKKREYASVLREIRESYVFSFGNSSQIGADYLIENAE